MNISHINQMSIKIIKPQNCKKIKEIIFIQIGKSIQTCCKERLFEIHSKILYKYNSHLIVLKENLCSNYEELFFSFQHLRVFHKV